MRTNFARPAWRALAAAMMLLASAVAVVEAAEVQSVSNPVANGAIVIDGNLSDWAAVTPFFQDTIGDGSSGPARPLDIDILQGAIAHDDNSFYVLYRNAGDNMVDDFSNWVFFDLDRNPATGYRATPQLSSIGMEFNLGGTQGWNAFNAAGAFVGGANGKTVAVGDSLGFPPGAPDFLEFSISRTAAQPNGLTFNPIGGNSFNVVFGAEDTVMDTYPNNANVDWFNYRVEIPEPTTCALGGVVMVALGCLRRRRI